MRLLEAGVDEAGRGCGAGPVVAAAVILPKKYINPAIKDSKIVKSNERDRLELEIKEVALSYGIGVASVQEIDEYNILNATFLAMERSILQLKNIPKLVLIDGNRFKTNCNISFQTIIEGDAIYQSIAAASILAKTHRDKIMLSLDQEYPEYDWKNNKGYLTEKHREACHLYGLTPWHRKSFKIL